MERALLEVKDLAIQFKTEHGTSKAVDGISLQIFPGETFGLVGESGCGKSVTALSILKLLPSPPAILAGGEVFWQKRNIWRLPHEDLVRLRGKEIGLIFQEPMTSFNPVKKIGWQISEVLETHTFLTPPEIRQRVLEMLRRVGINDPKRSYDAYPHELSGGMRQRAMIAMALICQPQLVVADEPTTALDVTIQAQILELLKELQKADGMSILLITHNLGIIAETAHRVAVMYMGKIVELASVKDLYKNPLHPYTRGLLASIPRLDKEGSLQAIPGLVPDALHLPTGCYFAPRCPQATERCCREYPQTREVFPGHTVSCWLWLDQ